MKPKLIVPAFLLVLCIPFLAILHSHSQQPGNYSGNTDINVVDAAGLRQGYWKITAAMAEAEGYSSPLTSIVKEGSYKDGDCIGTWKEYHPDGSHTDWEYNADHVHAFAKRFMNTTLIAETPYENNIHQGVAKKYYPDGTLWTEMTWNDGRLDGPAKTYYPDGKLCEEGWWQHNYWVGSYKLYNANGKLIRETEPPVVVMPAGMDNTVINGH